MQHFSPKNITSYTMSESKNTDKKVRKARPSTRSPARVVSSQTVFAFFISRREYLHVVPLCLIESHNPPIDYKYQVEYDLKEYPHFVLYLHV